MAEFFYPAAPTHWPIEEEHRRKIAEVTNNVLDGKINSTGTVTLTQSATSTVVTDNRAGANSTILFMPTTANAAAEYASGSMYVSSRGKQTFTITHQSLAQSDLDFAYVVLG